MHVLLFDIDGTLISSGGAGKAALEAAAAEEFGGARPTDALVLSGRTDVAIVRDLLAIYEIADTPENRGRLVAGYLRHLPRCLEEKAGRVLPGIQGLLGQLG